MQLGIYFEYQWDQKAYLLLVSLKVVPKTFLVPQMHTLKYKFVF